MIRTIQDIQLGEKLNHPSRGTGEVINRTKRTITIKWPFSTQKVSYRTNDARFNVCDL